MKKHFLLTIACSLCGFYLHAQDVGNITFADAKVKEICVANWDTNGDGELSLSEAATVGDLGTVFTGNTHFSSFDELQYFIGLETICKEAFHGCYNLKNITLPESVDSINARAFANCETLSVMHIPASVKYISDAAFRGADGIKTLTVDANNPVFDSRYNCNGIIETATNTLVIGCNTTVIPNDVVAIGLKAFRSMHIISSVVIPSSVVNIGELAFDDCINLASVTVGWQTPLTISANAFSNKAKATLYVPVGSKSAYESATVWQDFKEIIENANISFADAKVKGICVANWDTNGDGELSMSEAAAVTSLDKVFEGNKEIVSFDELQYFIQLESIKSEEFSDCDLLSSVVLPNNIKTIGQSAFFASNINSIEIPASVDSITDAAFNNCDNLDRIVVAEGNLVYDSRNNCNGIIETATNTLVAGCKNTVIPESVTAIGVNAFRNSLLTSILIPQSVINIGADAFYNCKVMTTVVVFNSTPIDLPANSFNSNKAKATLYVPVGSKSAYESAAVWQDFKEIIENANISFADAKVKEICVANWDTNGDGELSYAEAAVVKSLGRAFKDNAGITTFNELQYFTALEKISGQAFYNCSSLTSVTLSSNVKVIDQNAFYATGITSIELPASVTTIADAAFNGNANLSSITVSEGNTVYDSRNGCNGVIETSTNTLVLGCKNTVIPDGVAIIGSSAFRGCTTITSIIVPKSVTAIGANAFRNCTNLTSAIIPSSVANIEADAFLYCYNLSSITVGRSVPFEWTSGNTFSNLANATLYVPAGSKPAYESAVVWNEFKEIVEIENIAFADSKVKEVCVSNWDTNGDGELSLSEAATVGDLGTVFTGNTHFSSFDELQYFIGLETICKKAFHGCYNLKNITLPESVDSINAQAFANCETLSVMHIPASVKYISDAAFRGADGIKTLTVDANNPVFDSRYNCNGIIETATNTLVIGCNTTVIPNDVVAIGLKAFRSMHIISSVVIPSSVVSIGELAFDDCLNLASVTVGWQTPLTIPANAFSNNAKATLYVPVGSKSAYESAAVWQDFKVIIENANISFADAKVKEICVANWDTNGDGELSLSEAATVGDLGTVFTGNTHFSSFDELQYFIGLETICKEAFHGCYNLKNITLPESVDSINARAFANCESLSVMHIPASVKYISDAAFRGADGIKTLTVDANNPVFDSRYNCNGIIETATNTLVIGCNTTVIPNDVVAIGLKAFRSMHIISSVVIPSSVVSIGELAFDDCLNLASVTVGWQTPLTIPANAFSNNAKATLYVPYGTKSAYEVADCWSEYSKIVESPNIFSWEGNVSGATMIGGSIVGNGLNEGYINMQNNDYYTIGVNSKKDNIELDNITITLDYPLEAGDQISITGYCDKYNDANGTLYMLFDNGYVIDEGDNPVWNNIHASYGQKPNTNTYLVGEGAESKTIKIARSKAGTNVYITKIVITRQSNDYMQNNLVLSNMTLSAGQSTLFPVALNNGCEVTAFQCDICLPEGITLQQDDKGKYDITLDENRADDHTVTSALQEDGSLRIVVASLSSSVFLGNSGNLFYLNLLAEEGLTGEHKIVLKNIHISEANGTRHDLNDTEATLTIQAYTPADVNNDGLIAVDDVVLTINGALGITADNFLFAAADMNADGQILVDDVVQVINSVLGISTANVMTTRSTMLESLTVADTEGGFNMNVTNAANYVAMQFDMTLPEGASLNDIQVTSSSNHAVATREMENGVVRVIVSSLTNDAFRGDQLLNVGVSVNETATIRLTNAYVATCGGTLVSVSDAEITRAGATGIHGIEKNATPANIYDLSGRLVKENATSTEGLQKGIYLMNGKKVVVK